MLGVLVILLADRCDALVKWKIRPSRKQLLKQPKEAGVKALKARSKLCGTTLKPFDLRYVCVCRFIDHPLTRALRRATREAPHTSHSSLMKGSSWSLTNDPSLSPLELATISLQPSLNLLLFNVLLKYPSSLPPRISFCGEQHALRK